MSSTTVVSPNDEVFVDVKQNNHLIPGCSKIVKSKSCSSLGNSIESRKLRPRRGSSKIEERDLVKKIRAVVDQTTLSCDDLLFLEQHKPLVKLVKQRRSSYSKLKERCKEVEDEPIILKQSCLRLAEALKASRHAILYTGAGISTAANIPDYRGVDGVWTKLQMGKSIAMDQSLVTAEPTYTHMAIRKLVEVGLVKHVVSQNCDGLHVRSGMPPDKLSEIHGSMFAEVCVECHKNFYRIFDVTELTGLRRHMTSRTCDVCDGKLRDTIVHFGERSARHWPHFWEQAEKHAQEADLVVCLGSSLKVLRSYKQLWHADRPKNQRPRLYIVNMQWTPKDSQAHLKINGRSDEVMQQVMLHLGLNVDGYQRANDTLLNLAAPVQASERESFRTLCISVPPDCTRFAECSTRLNTRKVAIVGDDRTEGADVDGDTSPDLEELASAQSSSRDVVVPGWFGKGRRKAMPRKTLKRRKKKIRD